MDDQPRRTQLGELMIFGLVVDESGFGVVSQLTAAFSAICTLMIECRKNSIPALRPENWWKHCSKHPPIQVIPVWINSCGYGGVNIKKAMERLGNRQKPKLKLYANLDSRISA